MSNSSEIIALVHSRESVIAWIVGRDDRWFGIAFIPDDKREAFAGTGLLGGSSMASTALPRPTPDGDGLPTFVCGNPAACGKVHQVHHLVATNLIRRATEETPPAPGGHAPGAPSTAYSRARLERRFPADLRVPEIREAGGATPGPSV